MENPNAEARGPWVPGSPHPHAFSSGGGFVLPCFLNPARGPFFLKSSLCDGGSGEGPLGNPLPRPVAAGGGGGGPSLPLPQTKPTHHPLLPAPSGGHPPGDVPGPGAPSAPSLALSTWPKAQWFEECLPLPAPPPPDTHTQHPQRGGRGPLPHWGLTRPALHALSQQRGFHGSAPEGWAVTGTVGERECPLPSHSLAPPDSPQHPALWRHGGRTAAELLPPVGRGRGPPSCLPESQEPLPPAACGPKAPEPPPAPGSASSQGWQGPGTQV